MPREKRAPRRILRPSVLKTFGLVGMAFALFFGLVCEIDARKTGRLAEVGVEVDAEGYALASNEPGSLDSVSGTEGPMVAPTRYTIVLRFTHPSGREVEERHAVTPELFARYAGATRDAPRSVRLVVDPGSSEWAFAEHVERAESPSHWVSVILALASALLLALGVLWRRHEVARAGTSLR